MARIVALGELLVEMVALAPDQGFRRAGHLHRPGGAHGGGHGGDRLRRRGRFRRLRARPAAAAAGAVAGVPPLYVVGAARRR